MGYATQSDLVSRFGETEIIRLSNRSNTSAIDEAVVAAKLADADAEVDAYLQQRYTLPLATVPAVLRRVACDIGRYHLYADRATEDVIRRYNDAIGFLKSVAAGKAGIGVDQVGEAAPESDSPEIATGGRTFTHASLRGFGR